MAEVCIATARGISLAGAFLNPADSRGVAVLFIHPFLSDRHNFGWFDLLGTYYRRAGYATLAIDCGGCGTSDNEVITQEHTVDDITSACQWLNDHNFHRITIHAHGYGAQAALIARPTSVNSMIVSSPVCDQRDIPWGDIFDEQQLHILNKTGTIPIPDDTASPRTHFAISCQTMRDMTLTSAQTLLSNLAIPTLFMFDQGDVNTGLSHLLTNNWGLLPDVGHRLTVIPDLDFSQPFNPKTTNRHGRQKLIEACDQWMEEHQNVA